MRKRRKPCRWSASPNGRINPRRSSPAVCVSGRLLLRTVMTGSDLLLLDEPFSALDYLTRLSMREWLLQQWEQDKKTILFITHDVEEAVYLSNRVLVAEEIPMTSLSSVEVPAGYPRTRERMREPGMLLLKEELIDRLRRKDG